MVSLSARVVNGSRKAMPGFMDKVAEYFKDEMAKKVVSWVMSFLAFSATSIWAYLKGTPLPIAVAITLAGCPIVACAVLRSLKLYDDRKVKRTPLPASSSEITEADRMNVARRLTETRQELVMLRDRSRTAAPQPGPNFNIQKLLKFTIDIRDKIISCIASYNEHTASIPNTWLDTESFKSLIDLVDLRRKIDQTIEMIDTIQSKI
jgi:hypothetical protein